MKHIEKHQWHTYELTVYIEDDSATFADIEGPDCWGTWSSVQDGFLYHGRHDEERDCSAAFTAWVEKKVHDYEERHEKLGHYPAAA